jgi:hypothetical protein
VFYSTDEQQGNCFIIPIRNQTSYYSANEKQGKCLIQPMRNKKSILFNQCETREVVRPMTNKGGGVSFVFLLVTKLYSMSTINMKKYDLVSELSGILKFLTSNC